MIVLHARPSLGFREAVDEIFGAGVVTRERRESTGQELQLEWRSLTSAVGTSTVYMMANCTSAEATAATGRMARGKATLRTSVPLSATEPVAAPSALVKNIQGSSPLRRNSGKRSIWTRTMRAPRELITPSRRSWVRGRGARLCSRRP